MRRLSPTGLIPHRAASEFPVGAGWLLGIAIGLSWPTWAGAQPDQTPAARRSPAASMGRVVLEEIDGTTVSGPRIVIQRVGTKTHWKVGGRVVAATDLLRWDRIPPRTQPSPKQASREDTAARIDRVELVGGDRIVGHVLRADEEAVWVAWSLAGIRRTWRVPLELVRVMVLGRLSGAVMSRAAHRGGRGGADEVWLAGGDRLTGSLMGVSGDFVEVETGDVRRRVSRESVSLVTMDPSLETKMPRAADHVRIALRCGSRLTSGWPILGEDGRVKLTWVGVTDASRSAEETVDLELPPESIDGLQRFGVGLIRLENRMAVRSSHVPFIGPVRLPIAGRSIGGGPLIVRGAWVAGGLGMSSRSRMSWRLNPGDRAFCSRVGIDDTVGQAGDVTVRVLVDGNVAWESREISGGGTVRRVGPIDVRGARRLTLEVDYGRRADVGDRTAWLDPRLLPARP